MSHTVTLAMDKSVRSKSVDGQLFVEVSPISKACISPYLGSEIPDGDCLGLVMDQVYNLYRDPVELALAADSFRGVPVLITHAPTSADDHPIELTVGAVGTDVAFNAPYLEASLSIWTEEAITGIETKAQTEISSGYHFTADMTPGTCADGAYDGVMRNIKGNHIALVVAGRAGPDVVVLDHKPTLTLRMIKMPTVKKVLLSRKAAAINGALRAYLTPKLAQDAALGSLGALLGDVRAATFAKQKAEIVRRVTAHMSGKMAKDADLSDLALAMDATDDPEIAEDDDETDEEKEKRLAKEGAKDEFPDKDDDKPSKAAMDAAIKSAVAASTKANNDLHQARKDVQPMVGDVVLDTAEEVYKFALDHAKVDTAGVTGLGSLRALVIMAQEKKTVAPVIGMDSAAAAQVAKQFPHLNRFTRA